MNALQVFGDFLTELAQSEGLDPHELLARWLQGHPQVALPAVAELKFAGPWVYTYEPWDQGQPPAGIACGCLLTGGLTAALGRREWPEDPGPWAWRTYRAGESNRVSRSPAKVPIRGEEANGQAETREEAFEAMCLAMSRQGWVQLEAEVDLSRLESEEERDIAVAASRAEAD